jgi:cation:H+ antiporter
MFGGNAFAPALFVVADLLAGTPALPHARPSDVWMAALGVVMTSIFVVSMIVRPRRTRLRIGADSRLAVVVYVLGVLGLLAVPGGN